MKRTLKMTRVINMYPSGKGEFGFTVEFNHNIKVQYLAKCVEGKYIIINAYELDENYGMMMYKQGLGLIHAYKCYTQPIDWGSNSSVKLIEYDIPYGMPFSINGRVEYLVYDYAVCYHNPKDRRMSIIPCDKLPEKLRIALDGMVAENMLL